MHNEIRESKRSAKYDKNFHDDTRNSSSDGSPSCEGDSMVHRLGATFYQTARIGAFFSIRNARLILHGVRLEVFFDTPDLDVLVHFLIY